MKRRIVLVLTLSLCGVGAFAQESHDVNLNVSPVALLGIYDGAQAADPDITLVLDDTGLAAGEIPTPDTNDTEPVFLRYTVINGPADTSLISVAITAGTIPAGTTLEVVAAPVAAGGQGADEGTTGGTIDLSVGGDAITGITNWATGIADGAGAAVTYTLSVDDVSLLDPLDDDTVTITYTLTL